MFLSVMQLQSSAKRSLAWKVSLVTATASCFGEILTSEQIKTVLKISFPGTYHTMMAYRYISQLICGGDSSCVVLDVYAVSVYY